MLNEAFPKSNVYFNAVNVTHSTPESAYLSFANWEQCRRKHSVDSILRPQLHNGLIVS